MNLVDALKAKYPGSQAWQNGDNADMDKRLTANWSIVYVLIDFMIDMAASAIYYMIIKRSRIASMLFGLKPKAKKIAVTLEARCKFDKSAIISQN